MTSTLPRDQLTGRYDQVSKIVRGSKRDATAAAAALLTEVRRGSTPTKGTFGDLLTAYIDPELEGSPRRRCTATSSSLGRPRPTSADCRCEC